MRCATFPRRQGGVADRRGEMPWRCATAAMLRSGPRARGERVEGGGARPDHRAPTALADDVRRDRQRDEIDEVASNGLPAGSSQACNTPDAIAGCLEGAHCLKTVRTSGDRWSAGHDGAGRTARRSPRSIRDALFSDRCGSDPSFERATTRAAVLRATSRRMVAGQPAGVLELPCHAAAPVRVDARPGSAMHTSV